MDKNTFLKKLDRIPDLPTLPVVAMKVNKMLQDHDVSINMVSKTIEKDQSMVSKILKLVNSAFYGFGSKINTISHAVTILGFNTVRNAVVSVAVIDAFSDKECSEGFSLLEFWQHSLAVAVTGRHLATRSRLIIPDEAFVAGILHDIGKLVLTQYFEDLFNQVWTRMKENELSFYEAEKELLPAGHAQIGGRLAKKWRLPQSLTEGLSYHHFYRKSAINVNLISVVHISDFIVNKYKVNGNHVRIPEPHPAAAKMMKSELESVEDWFPEVRTEIDQACDFFIPN
jgi:putative nucleotidyltransferase with HDIG domain